MRRGGNTFTLGPTGLGRAISGWASGKAHSLPLSLDCLSYFGFPRLIPSFLYNSLRLHC